MIYKIIFCIQIYGTIHIQKLPHPESYLLSRIGALLSLVTVFFSFFPLVISDNKAFRPACSDLLRDGFSVFACKIKLKMRRQNKPRLLATKFCSNMVVT